MSFILPEIGILSRKTFQSTMLLAEFTSIYKQRYTVKTNSTFSSYFGCTIFIYYCHLYNYYYLNCGQFLEQVCKSLQPINFGLKDLTTINGSLFVVYFYERPNISHLKFGLDLLAFISKKKKNFFFLFFCRIFRSNYLQT